MPPSVRMSQPLRVAGFELIISGRFWVIAKGGRTTEIDFINGYVVDTARQFGLDTPINTAIVEAVYAITRGQNAPDPNLLGQILQAGR